jgi:hypothetical protein
MKKSMLLAGAALLFSAAASPALAQSTISPGMTEAQVRGRFGEPATTRAAGAWTYWYYHNGCPNRCGSDDVVFFQNDRVVAAVLRTSRRRFSGPAADDAINANHVSDRTGHDTSNDAPADGRARVGGVRVEQPQAEVIVVPRGDDDDDRDRPRAREGRPGEPSTTVITNPGTMSAAQPGTPVGTAREGQPGEPSTTVIAAPATGAAAGTNPPAVDGPLPTTQPAPAATRNTEAADTRGETSVDRKNRRERQDRANEPTATERARRNDEKNP